MQINEAYLTQTTRDMLDGRKPARRNMTNGKPYRTKAQKAVAKEKAEKRADGTYRSTAPVSYHPTTQVSA